MKSFSIVLFLLCFLLPSILCWKSSTLSYTKFSSRNFPLRSFSKKYTYKDSTFSFSPASSISASSSLSSSSLSSSSLSSSSSSYLTYSPSISSLSSSPYFNTYEPSNFITPISLDQPFFQFSSSFSFYHLVTYGVFLSLSLKIFQILLESQILSNILYKLSFFSLNLNLFSIKSSNSFRFFSICKDKVFSLFHSISSLLSKIFPSLFSAKVVKNVWRSCRLVSVDPLEGNENFAKFRFEILNKKRDGKERDLDILSGLNLNGFMNKIILCREDNFGGLIKREFNPFVLPSYYSSSKPSPKYPVLQKIGLNEFEIIVNVNSKENQSDLRDTLPLDSESFEFLKTLELNDTLAFKLGQSIFQFNKISEGAPISASPPSHLDSSHSASTPPLLDPIKELTIIASEEGIIPIIQLLNSFLSANNKFKKSLTFNKINLLWINSSMNFFILQNELERLIHLSRSLHSPFLLNCEKILDIDLALPKTVLNIKLRDKLPDKLINEFNPMSLIDSQQEAQSEESHRHLTILSIPNQVTHSKFLDALRNKGNKIDSDIISVHS